MRGINALTNVMRQQAQMAGNDSSLSRIGTISSYDAASHAVKVLIQPEGTESNWMPLGAIGIGNGWGVAIGPQLGDQVHVLFEHGDFEAGTIVARVFSTVQAAPPVPSGEIWALHESGSFAKLVNSGDVDINAAANCNITVTGNANVNVSGNAHYTASNHTFTGPVQMQDTLTVAQLTSMNGGFAASGNNGSGSVGTINGSVTATGTVTGQSDVIGGGKSLASHTHNDPQGGTTSPPN
jgi:phage baseplate assembly protein gpV